MATKIICYKRGISKSVLTGGMMIYGNKATDYFYRTRNSLKFSVESQNCLVKKKEAIYFSLFNFVKNYQIIVSSVSDGSVTGRHFVPKYYAAVRMANYFQSIKGKIK